MYAVKEAADARRLVSDKAISSSGVRGNCEASCSLALRRLEPDEATKLGVSSKTLELTVAWDAVDRRRCRGLIQWRRRSRDNICSFCEYA